jgi:hypothetical protein
MKLAISWATQLFPLATIVGVSFSYAQTATAQTCNYYAGQASGGQAVNVDLCSISRASYRSVDFTYYLGDEKIYSQANCQSRTWITFPEKVVHRPQSKATQNMLNIVCSYRGAGSSASMVTGFIFDPPSNVRVSPNGSILCSVKERTQVNIYGSTGDWYYTDACGQMGVIHSSQIRF